MINKVQKQPESQLRHLQRVILSIAKDIDELCRQNGIKYYLVGGSAIGAVRHHGFIPWDDDLDIIMDDYNYKRFLQIAQEQLDKDKYFVCEGRVDWPLYFTKVKLKNTHLQEHEGRWTSDTDGIYVDVFKMDNVSNNKLIARWQYFCGKYYMSYLLAQRTYGSASVFKRIIMFMTFPLKVSVIRNFVVKQSEKYNNTETKFYGFFHGRNRYKSSVIRKDLFGEPLYVPFEDTMLPIQERYQEYLTQVFGDYMKLPPEEKRVGLHLIDVDFGEY